MYFVRLEQTFLDFVSFSQLWSKIFICEINVAEQFVLSIIRTRPWRTCRYLAPRLHNICSFLPSLTFPAIPFPPVWVVSTLNQGQDSYPRVWLTGQFVTMATAYVVWFQGVLPNAFPRRSNVLSLNHLPQHKRLLNATDFRCLLVCGPRYPTRDFPQFRPHKYFRALIKISMEYGLRLLGTTQDRKHDFHLSLIIELSFLNFWKYLFSESGWGRFID